MHAHMCLPYMRVHQSYARVLGPSSPQNVAPLPATHAHTYSPTHTHTRTHTPSKPHITRFITPLPHHHHLSLHSPSPTHTPQELTAARQALQSSEADHDLAAAKHQSRQHGLERQLDQVKADMAEGERARCV